MGTHYRISCHTCKQIYAPSFLKLREIQLNENVSAELGRFVCMHPNCDIELWGDEFHTPRKDSNNYKRIELKDLDTGD